MNDLSARQEVSEPERLRVLIECRTWRRPEAPEATALRRQLTKEQAFAGAEHRLAAARSRRQGPPRGEADVVEVFDGDERVSLIGHETYGSPLWQIRTLAQPLREVGLAYGALAEELAGSGRSPSEFGVPSGGGGQGAAIDRRLAVRQL
ncbi:MAG: hypothetical protein AAGA32_17430 [Pseudomonadota bacterium]